MRTRTFCRRQKVSAWDGTPDKFFGLATSEFMPEKGQGDTVANQIAVAANRIVGRWFNDGDVISKSCYLGYPEEHVVSCANWLYANGPQGCRGILRDAESAIRGDEYSDLMRSLCEECLDVDVLYTYADKPAVGSVFKCDGPFSAWDDDDDDDEHYGRRRGPGSPVHHMNASTMLKNRRIAIMRRNASEWDGLPYWDPNGVSNSENWRQLVDDVMTDVMVDAPYESKQDFYDAVSDEFYLNICEMFNHEFNVDIYYYICPNGNKFAKDVEKYLIYNANIDNNHPMSDYYN